MTYTQFSFIILGGIIGGIIGSNYDKTFLTLDYGAWGVYLGAIFAASLIIIKEYYKEENEKP